MALLDVFLSALRNERTGEVDPLRVARMMGKAAGVIEQVGSKTNGGSLLSVLGAWALGVAKAAPSRWMLPAGVAPSCVLEVEKRPCGAFAISGCHVCGQPVCLAHALLGGEGTVVCWGCARVAKAHAKPWIPPRSQVGAPTDWAYELLGVERGATPDEVKKAYKRRIAAFHPDKAAPDKQGPSGDLVRSFKKAYDAILAEQKASQ